MSLEVLVSGTGSILDAMDEASLYERIKVVERRLDVDTIRLILAGELLMDAVAPEGAPA